MNNISVGSATQLNRILFFLPENMKMKIPEEVWDKINDKTDNSIDTHIYQIKDINEENIFSETKKYLSYIFLNYLATEEEKKEYNQILKSNEERHHTFLNEKYSVDKMFKKKKAFQKNVEETKLPVQIEKNIFKIILDKIKKLFRWGN